MGLTKLTSTLTGFDLIQAEPVKFKSLPHAGGAAHESELEDLLARHIDLLLGDVDETQDTLLIIGRQVRTSTDKRMDLVALDATGALVVIEVKRDAEDAKARKDHGEMQAIRYAASLANLRTPEELALNLLVPYLQGNGWAIDRKAMGSRSLEEYARQVLTSFIGQNAISEEALNHHQRIILVGATFDPDTTSAAAWLAANGVPIEVFEVNPLKVGEDYFLNSNRVIPPDPLEAFYTDILPKETGRRGVIAASGIKRTYRIRMGEMIANGKVQVGDTFAFKGRPSATCKVFDGSRCTVDGKQVSYLAWAKELTGWGAVNIYEWLVHQPTGKLLEDLRRDLESELSKKESQA